MRRGVIPCVGGIWLALSFFSCATQPAPSPAQPPAPPQTEVAPATVPESPQPPPTPEPPPPPPPPVKEEPPPPPMVPPKKVESEDVKITEEEYAKTFKEVEQVIDELNSIIKAGDYVRWEQYLTPQFKASVMNPEALRRINEQPLLKRNKIEIKTLHDYFMYVVVPSRASVRLDDLIFTQKNRVKAFMIIRQDPVLIYQLEKIGDSWKISVW